MYSCQCCAMHNISLNIWLQRDATMHCIFPDSHKALSDMYNPDFPIKIMNEASLMELLSWYPIIIVKSLQLTWRSGTSKLSWYLPLDKMAAILADDKFKCIFMNENYRIPLWISLKFVPKSPIDNTPTLVQVMAWRRKGDKPLPDAMINQFTDAYLQH